MTYTSANSYTWAKVQVPHPFSSSNSSTCAPVDLGFPSKSISMRKPTPRAKIQCALHSPTFLTFLKQPYQYPTITKRDTPSPPQPAWNLFQKAAAKALDIMESALISRDKQNPLPKTADPGVQLAGNFSPVPEMPVRHNLPVTGTVPDCINGVYVRNGANPHFEPVAGHHFFDGDGMLHAVTINGGSVNYSCRFTETERLVQECELGKSVFPKAIGEIHGHSGIARLLLFYARGLCGLVDHSHGTGVANAGLVYFNGRLLAMSEDDLPYHVAIKPCGDLQTKGRYDFDEQLKSTMIAHPKIDPVSGELFSLSYDVVKKPYLKYFKFSKNGKKSYDVEIPLDVPTMMHDFAITENYVVIPDQQVVFKLQNMIKGGSPVIYDEKKKSRFGILPKSAKDSNSIIWVESPDTFCFHLWNAWEEAENDEVVVIGSCITPPDSIFHESDENLKSVLSEVRLNLKTAESRKRVITEQVNLEAGMVNKNKLGRKTQYAYLAIAEPWPKVSGFAKVDLSTGEIQKYMYGDKRYGGEPLFLPRNQRTEKEDDGYILAFVHDERICKSELQIVNAITLELEATVKLPSRVPYGFHGTFVSSKDLQNQVLGKLS